MGGGGRGGGGAEGPRRPRAPLTGVRQVSETSRLGSPCVRHSPALAPAAAPTMAAGAPPAAVVPAAAKDARPSSSLADLRRVLEELGVFETEAQEKHR